MNALPHFPIGQPVPLNISTRDAIFEHLCTLSRDDLYDRFAFNATPDFIASYVHRINFSNDVCLGIFEEGQRLSGLIHLCVYGHIAELAASVIPNYQSRGRGVLLFRSAIDLAISIGVQEIHLATGHLAAYRIIQRLGYPIKYGGDYPNAIITLT